MKLLANLVLVAILSSCGGPVELVYSTDEGAIAGFDPVSYFTNEKPEKGSEEFSCMWKGAKWFFASDENRKTFEGSPETYAPQYGGYCAYAISQGYTAKIDPKCWKIVDEKLYLNYNPEIQEKWENEQFEYIMYADSNWPKILSGDI